MREYLEAIKLKLSGIKLVCSWRGQLRGEAKHECKAIWEWSTGIVLMSPWRVCEARRKEAKTRDKEAIAALTSKVTYIYIYIEEQLCWGQEWHWQYEESEGFHIDKVLSGLADDSGVAEQSQSNGQPVETNMRAKCIGYSKWDHLDDASGVNEQSEDYDDECEEEEVVMMENEDEHETAGDEQIGVLEGEALPAQKGG